jgi:N-acetylneuraminate 9-O-acetyltransferase
MSSGKWYQDRIWVPTGCETEPYGSRFSIDCLSRRKVVFAGDITVEHLYWAMANKLDHGVFPTQLGSGNLHFSKDNVDVDFIHDPFINSTDLIDKIHSFRYKDQDAPALVVLGTAFETGTELDVFDDNLRSIANILPSPDQRHTSSATAGPGSNNLILFAPAQHQVPSSEDVNIHLQHGAKEYGLDVLWSFAGMTDHRPASFQDDGRIVRWEVSHQMMDVVLGLRCNADSIRTRSFPNIRTCCGTWAGPNWVQSSILVMGLVLLPAAVGFDYLVPLLSSKARSTVRAGAAFFAMVSLQYCADRTHVFEQVKRLPLHMPNLTGMLVITVIIGGVSIRKLFATGRHPNTSRPFSPPFLPRDQSDEMKGWMQLLIILYHYNMAWTNDRYWEIIRLAVSSYLFLTGFGHTVYFLQKGDYSFQRFVAVLIRTNLLPCTLAYLMRTRWLLYYYMPLSTFWFLVVYGTMTFQSKFNKFKMVVIAKILVCAALLHLFLETRDLADTVVRLFTITCKISFNSGEFFGHRVKIDQYIVFLGMLVGVFYVWAKEALSDSHHTGLAARLFRRSFIWLNVVAVILAFIAFIGFWYWLQANVHSQSEWTALQPYITPIPILSFLVLRNAHPILRSYFSAGFAWLGKYSGEMYVMQDHLWLAGDQEAVLRTGLFHGDETVANDRWRDLVLLTPVYLIACAVVGESTARITTWFVSTEERPPVPPKDDRVMDDAEMGLLSEKLKEPQYDQNSLRNLAKSLRWPSLRTRFWLLLAFMWVLNMVSWPLVPAVWRLKC